MKKSEQFRRPSNFFEANINPNATKKASGVCREALIIYDIWDGGDGVNELFDYLVDDLECSKQEAEAICKYYSPENPPTEVCPLDAIKSGNFGDVFRKLALQLPSLDDQGNGVWPKDLLAWKIQRKVYGSDAFDFELIGTGLSGDNKIIFPRLINGPDGNPLPFGLAALNAINVGEIPASVMRKADTLISNLGEIGIAFAKALIEADFIFPPNKTLNKLIEVIKRGIEGETVILSGAFCPDYAYVESNDSKVQYKYTFKNIGNDVGLVAQQFVRVMPFLVKFFDEHSIKYKIKLGIGDFEANSSEILQSVGVTREEFTRRCLMSLEAFKEELSDLDMDLCLFERDWANGRWLEYLNDARGTILSGDFGKIKTNTGKDPVREASFIAKDGASFYRRWYEKPEMDLAEITDLVVSQGAEYAAMGRIFSEDFKGKPFIQIAGDRPKMQIFNSFDSDHPTICCKRVY